MRKGSQMDQGSSKGKGGEYHENPLPHLVFFLFSFVPLDGNTFIMGSLKIYFRGTRVALFQSFKVEVSYQRLLDGEMVIRESEFILYFYPSGLSMYSATQTANMHLTAV